MAAIGPQIGAGTMRCMHLVVRRLIGLLVILAVAYFGYMGMEGSHRLVNGFEPNADCRTPGQLGIAYEAINYDIATDAELAAREPDPNDCSASGAAPGDGLVTSDGMRLAGWYVPAASGGGPEGSTVVLSHGWNDNKSGMLDVLPIFHDRYNLVLFDFRNHGQSADGQITQGIREQDDLAAVIDWLVAEKGQETIVLWGRSMGGHAAVNVAADDARVDGLILDSTHSRVRVPMSNRIGLAGYPFGEVGYVAVAFGAWLRTGVNVLADDPITAIDDLGSRPVLLIHPGNDDTIPLSDAEELRDAAVEAGVEARLEVCADSGHGGPSAACPTDYRRWVSDFMDEVLRTAPGS